MEKPFQGIEVALLYNGICDELFDFVCCDENNQCMTTAGPFFLSFEKVKLPDLVGKIHMLEWWLWGGVSLKKEGYCP
jgi:hypothetical protein